MLARYCRGLAGSYGGGPLRTSARSVSVLKARRQCRVVGSERGQLWALDPNTGAPVWSTNVGAPIKEPKELGGNPPTPGLTAGQGRLLVPASNTLSAYGQ